MTVRRRSRKPLWALAVVAAAAAAAATTITTFAGGPSRDAPDPPHTPYVRLAGGVRGGAAWQLLAWEQGSRLCMEVLPAGEDPDHLATRPPSTVGGGGCGFDDREPGGGFVGSASWSGESSFAFGPLPSRATRIEVATRKTLTTEPLPQGKGLPEGRYWIFPRPAVWPTRAEGAALALPQPLDATGRRVSFQPF